MHRDENCNRKAVGMLKNKMAKDGVLWNIDEYIALKSKRYSYRCSIINNL